MAFRRIKRAFRKVKQAVQKAVEVVKDVVEFTLTGELDGTEGNDTLNAIGFAGKVKAKGGDDTVNAGAGSLVVEDTTGRLDIRGAAGRLEVRKSGAGDVKFRGAAGVGEIRSRGSIDFEGAAVANYLETVSDDATLRFRGAGASNTLRGVAATGVATSRIDVDFGGAGASNRIETRAAFSTVRFAGAGFSNRIGVVADHAEVEFIGAGGANRITVDTIAAEGAQAGAQEEATDARVRFDGAGADNVIEVGANDIEIDFNGAGARNRIEAVGHGRNSEADVAFTGAGGYTDIDVVADRARVRFDGAGVVNAIDVRARDGEVAFNGVGAGNTVAVIADGETVAGTRAKIDFNGGGGANILGAQAADIAITFRGAGAYNEIAALGLGADSHADVDYAGAGARNLIEVEADRGRVRFAGAGGWNTIHFATTDGDIDFAGAGVGNDVRLFGKENASGDTRGDIDFAGAGGANVVTSLVRHGDIDFTGVGLANVVTRAGDAQSTGDIRFVGGGGANVVTSDVNDGDIHFTGVGFGNAVTRLDRGADSRGDVVFTGGGGANVITSLVDRGDVAFTGVGAANVITRRGGAGSQGDVTFHGAGLGNVVTHLTDHGDAAFIGGGGGNALTRIGETGDVTFIGAGLANVIVHDVVEGDLSVLAVGGGNVVTRSGAGRSDVTLAGGLNVFTADMGRGAEAGGASDVNVAMAGAGNVLTTDVSGKTTAFMAGHANLATIRGEADVTAIGSVNVIETGAHADRIRSYGIANVITTSGDNNDIRSYGAFSIIRDGGEDTALSENTGGGALLVDRIAGATDAIVDTTIDGINGEGDAFSDPSIYLDAIEDAMALAEAGEAAGAAADPGAETQEASGGPASFEAELAARGLTEADLADGGVEDTGPGGDWATMTEGDLALRADADAAAGADARTATPATPDVADLTAALDAELAKHSAALEQAQRSTDEVAAEREAEGQARAGEAEEDAESSVGDGAKIPGVIPQDVEDDDVGAVGTLGGVGVEWAAGSNYNIALLLGLFNVVELGSKNDVVIAASLGNYVSTGAGDDIAVMIGAANVFRGGDGRDVAVQMAFGNVALMGAGDWDVGVQLGMANFMNKDADGHLYAFQFGIGNFVYHGGLTPGENANKSGNMTAVMGGYANVAHKQGDGAVTGVMIGNLNSLSHVGDGRFVGVLMGSINVATKVGAGDAYFFMGGNLNVATHVNAFGADSRTVFVMAGNANVATSVGDGLMVGLFLGRANVVTRVGNGDVYVGMLSQYGNALTVVNTENAALIAAVSGKVNAVTKVGDGMLVAVGYAGLANVVTHVGDGVMVAIEVGKLNVITKVGDSGIDGEDGATVMVAAGHLNVLSHVGDGTTVLVADGIMNVATKVGDGATAALLTGQANIAVHVGDGMMIGLSLSTARFTPGASRAKKVNAAGRLTGALGAGGNADRDALDIGAMTRDGAASAQEAEGRPSRKDRLMGAVRDHVSGDAFARDLDKLNGSVSAAYAKVRAKMPGGAGAPNVGDAGEALGDMAGQVQRMGEHGPDIGQTGGPGFSANIGAKFGDGDIYFAQVGLDRRDARGRRNDTDPTEGEAGAQLRDGAAQTGSGAALDAMFRGLSFDSSANIFFRLGDGRTVLAQRGDMNLVANWVDALDEDGRAVKGYAEHGPDFGLGFDFVHAAWGDMNISVDVSTDQLFVAGGLDGVAKLDAEGAPSAGRGRDALSLMMGSLNVSVKVGDGAVMRGMLGDLNLGVTIGNGTDNALAIGRGNLLVRVGGTIAGDDDNNLGGGAFGGFKAVVGNGNAIIEYGRSDSVFVAGAYSRPDGATADTSHSDLARRIAGGSYKNMTSFMRDQRTYLNSYTPPKGAGKVGWGTAGSVAGGLAELALFGRVSPGMANHGKEPGQNRSQFAKRSGANQTNKILGWLGGLMKTPEPPERDTEVNRQSKALSRNAGTYNDAYDLNRQIETISGAYFDGLSNGGNIVHAGAGADVVLTVGSGNLVFGDNISSLLADFSFAAFFPAHAQALSLNEIAAMLANRRVSTADDLADDREAREAAQAAHDARSTRRRYADGFRDGLIEGVEYIQTFVDVGVTIPYQTLGDMFNYGYNPDGSMTGYGADGEAVAGQLLNMFWIDLTLPSSVFGGVAGMGFAELFNKGTGQEMFDMAGTMMNGFLSRDEGETGEAGLADDPAAEDEDAIAALEEFMVGTDSEGDGSFKDLYSNAGIPVIPGIPNFQSLMETVLNFGEVVALGEGGPLDGLRNIAEKVDVLEGDGDVLVALGGGNMQFGGHGDDVMVTIGEVSHNFGGYGDDLMVSIGRYSYLNGNDGDDYLIAAGQYNVLHDQSGHNTVVAVGDRNDIRLGRGNDAIFVLGNKSKARGGSGYNFITALGAKNSIYLSGNDVVFGVGGDNNYYVLGGAGSRALIHNIGAAHVTFSPGVKAYVNALGGDISGSAGDDFLMFTRDYESGVILTDSDAGTEALRREAELDPGAFGAAWDALQDRGVTSQKDTVMMRGRNTVVFGGAGGGADKDIYVLGYGLKDGVLVDVAGERLGFGDETEDKIVIGERIGVADYRGELRDAPVIFRRDGDDLLILSPDHVFHRDAPGPLDADRMNSVRVKDYFDTMSNHAAQVVLSVWDTAGEDGVLQKWRDAFDAEEAAAAAASAASGTTVEAMHLWEDFDFSHYSYLDRDGIRALIAAHAALRAAPGGADLSEREIWAQVWAEEFDGENSRVKTGEGLSSYKLSMRDGLFLAGGAGNDLVEGAQLGDVIEGGAGDDTLRGAGGDDTLFGDAGNDVLDGGEGVDAVDYVKLGAAGVTVDMAAGTARYALDGRDWEDSLTGIEEVRGTAGNDILDGSGGADRLFGAGGDDVLRGHGGDDWLDGGTGANWIYGGDGDDTIALSGDLSRDASVPAVAGEIDGGAGSDTADASAVTLGVVFDLEAGQVRAGSAVVSFLGIENVTGSDFDDLIIGGAGVNVLKGGAGDDRFAGALSGDDVDGGDGWDMLDLSDAAAALTVDLGAGAFALGAGPVGAAAGIEEVRGGSGDDVIVGAAGVAEVFAGGLGANALTGNAGDGDMASYAGAAGAVNVDLRQGAATGAGFADALSGIEAVRGSAFGDVMIAGDAAVAFYGGDGDDVLIGGAGDDVFVGGAGADVIAGGDGDDTVDFGAAPQVGPELGPVVADLEAGTAARGGEVDTLSGVENLAGSAGNDALSGDAGANRLWGWLGDDLLEGRGGDDALYGEDGDDTLRGGDGGDLLEGGAGNDALFGGAGDDLLLGGDGDDVLHGGPGADVLVGGAGDDRYVVFGGAGTTRIEAEDGFEQDGEAYMTSMDDDSHDVLQIGEDGEGFTFQDIWFSRSGEDLLLEVLGEDGGALSAHTLSNWYLDGADAATRMDAFEAGDRVMAGGGVAQLVEAMAAWTADGGLDEHRREALRADAALTGQLAAVWQPNLPGMAAVAAV